MTGIAVFPGITVRREIEASAEELFDAWLDPDAIAIWMCPMGVTHSVARLDAREGGHFEVTMHALSESYWHRGVYQCIDRPRQLVFTWISAATHETESLVTVDFRAGRRSGFTEIVVTHERLPDQEAVASHAEGWSGALELLGNMHIG
ncbi:SRPBCC domain-containing protein [Uliginosibacterium sp. H3]|uniref:SRPBCC domain-containing protein n=1 Tax=Uliginosibacterium silvisoli TaxID=3114758 RepID=A0ABU6JZW2_9RHOO|nr:SRPBCC domain-containing protein [Uliginosibacterium sp. H3]